MRDLGYGPYFAVYEAVIRSRIGRGSSGYQEGGRGGIVKGEELESEIRQVGTNRVLIAGGLAGIAGWGST